MFGIYIHIFLKFNVLGMNKGCLNCKNIYSNSIFKRELVRKKEKKNYSHLLV